MCLEIEKYSVIWSNNDIWNIKILKFFPLNKQLGYFVISLPLAKLPQFWGGKKKIIQWKLESDYLNSNYNKSKFKLYYSFCVIILRHIVQESSSIYFSGILAFATTQ